MGGTLQEWPGKITHIDTPIELHPDFITPTEFYDELMQQVEGARFMCGPEFEWIAKPVGVAIVTGLLTQYQRWYANPDRYEFV